MLTMLLSSNANLSFKPLMVQLHAKVKTFSLRRELASYQTSFVMEAVSLSAISNGSKTFSTSDGEDS
jgi:hypothetical protein